RRRHTRSYGDWSSDVCSSDLSWRFIHAITKDCPAVAELAWMKRQLVQVVYGNQNWSTSAQGVTPAYPQVRTWPVAAGRFFDEKRSEERRVGKEGEHGWGRGRG